MKRILKTCIGATIVTGIVAGVGLNLSVFAGADTKPVKYLTHTNKIQKVNTLGNKKQEIKRDVVSTASEDQIGDDKIVWVDYEYLQSPKVKQKLLNLYNRGSKICIKKDNLSTEEVLDYFNLQDQKVGNSNQVVLHEDTTISKLEDSKLKRVAVSIQKKNDGYYDIKGLNTLKSNPESDTYNTMLFANETESPKEEGTLVAKSGIPLLGQLINPINIAYAEDYIPGPSQSWVDTLTLIKVSSSISIDKFSGNPSGGQYFTSRKTIVEAYPKDPSQRYCGIKDIYIWTDSNNTAKILDYGPVNTGLSDVNGNIGFNVGSGKSWGFSVDFSFYAMTKYSKSTGGIGYTYLQIHNWPSTNNGGSYYVYDTTYRGIVTSANYQDSTTTSNPSRYVSGVAYTVFDKNYLSKPNPTIYSESGPSHYASGY